jgi:hypothetical protein
VRRPRCCVDALGTGSDVLSSSRMGSHPCLGAAHGAGGESSRILQGSDDVRGGDATGHCAPVAGLIEDVVQGFVTWPAHGHEIDTTLMTEMVVARVMQVVG